MTPVSGEDVLANACGLQVAAGIAQLTESETEGGRAHVRFAGVVELLAMNDDEFA